MLGLVWTFPHGPPYCFQLFHATSRSGFRCSFFHSNVDGLQQRMKVFPAYHDEYLYVPMQKIVQLCACRELVLSVVTATSVVAATSIVKMQYRKK